MKLKKLNIPLSKTAETKIFKFPDKVKFQIHCQNPLFYEKNLIICMKFIQNLSKILYKTNIECLINFSYQFLNIIAEIEFHIFLLYIQFQAYIDSRNFSLSGLKSIQPRRFQ